ncbi:hypothetical protein [Deinococcus knuensis]|uniref:Uncharacterized protein n=1 Tax=Deinococcus knuensis TaxID=1837380 RepID=A0ABQ2SG35_9DEIO|nr:hypothetical protein [Deinococcus knuensis]GGS27497.1 hypothetical protein GCM10008961_18780 [Deinococcus knuensis]
MMQGVSQQFIGLMWEPAALDQSAFSWGGRLRAGLAFQLLLPGAGRVDAAKEGRDFRQDGGAVTGRARAADGEEPDACLSELLDFLPLPALVLGGGLEVGAHVGHGLAALRAEGRFSSSGEGLFERLAAVEAGVVLQAPGDLVALAAVNESGTGFAGHVLRLAAGLDAGIRLMAHLQIYRSN